MPHNLDGKGNYSVGDVLFNKDDKKAFKITDPLDDGPEFKGKPIYPDEEDNEVTIHIKQCTHCLTPHQFGQYKRYMSGGTGFKKRGRKFKKNHLRQLESLAYVRDQISFEEYVSKTEALANSVNEAINIVSRALSDKVQDRDLKQFLSGPNNTLKNTLREILSIYTQQALRLNDCERAVDGEILRLFGNRIARVYDGDVSLEDKQRIRQWVNNNLVNVYCPIN